MLAAPAAGTCQHELPGHVFGSDLPIATMKVCQCCWLVGFVGVHPGLLCFELKKKKVSWVSWMSNRVLHALKFMLDFGWLWIWVLAEEMSKSSLLHDEFWVQVAYQRRADLHVMSQRRAQVEDKLNRIKHQTLRDALQHSGGHAIVTAE